MPLTQPLKRTWRPFSVGAETSYWYMHHPDFASNPIHFIRAFEVLQKDLIELFDSIEPADSNEATYSYRVHGLLMRACIEVEANFKAIANDNALFTGAQLSMSGHYFQFNRSHHLSSYEVMMPVWTGAKNIRKPFALWSSGAYSPLPWYQAYNNSKHDRQSAFDQAHLGHLVDAICGLSVLLSAQFYTLDFSLHQGYVGLSGPPGYESAIGSYFLVKFPGDWADNDCYSFDSKKLKSVPHPIDNLLI